MAKKLTRKRISKKKRTQKRKVQRRQRGGEYSGYLEATKVGTGQPDSTTDKLSEPDSIPRLGSA